MKNQKELLKALRKETGKTQKEFAEWLHIPLPTLRDWEAGNRELRDYLFELIKYRVHH